MKLKVLLLLTIIAAAPAYAENDCDGSTQDVAYCLNIKLNVAIDTMNKYLEAAKENYKSQPEIVSRIVMSQDSWLKYSGDHCTAATMKFDGGSATVIYQPYCQLYMAKSRTYDLWREFLTYDDSTPPILPEPELILYSK